MDTWEWLYLKRKAYSRLDKYLPCGDNERGCVGKTPQNKQTTHFSVYL